MLTGQTCNFALWAKYKTMKKFILSVFLFTSFSLFAQAYGAERPLWIDNPGISFSKDDIYAVGSGANLNEAKSNARLEILKYFETNINSKFQGSMNADDKTTTKSTQEEIIETASGILKGIKITNTFKDRDGFYALAVLDKKKTLAELEYEIERIDTQMQTLSQNGDLNNMLGKIYEKRENLNRKYLFLSGKSIGAKIKYDDIYKSVNSDEALFRKRANMGGIQVKLVPENSGFQTLLTNYLRELGYNISYTGKSIFVKAENTEYHKSGKSWICHFSLEVSFKGKIISAYQAKGQGSNKEEALNNAVKDAVKNFPQNFY